MDWLKFDYFQIIKIISKKKLLYCNILNAIFVKRSPLIRQDVKFNLKYYPTADCWIFAFHNLLRYAKFLNFEKKYI